MRYKKLFVLLLALALLCGSLSGCASERQTAPAEPTVPFTDSLGRTVDIPETLTRVAPSGTVASMFLATIAPEYMTTINATPSSSQYKYLDPRLIDLPTTGQMYGSKSTLNLESILTSGAQVVIDLGDKKDNMAADLDALQSKSGMPVIFIEADLPIWQRLPDARKNPERQGGARRRTGGIRRRDCLAGGGKRRENSGFRAHFRPVHLRLVRPQYKRERLHSGAGTRPHGH